MLGAGNLHLFSHKDLDTQDLMNSTISLDFPVGTYNQTGTWHGKHAEGMHGMGRVRPRGCIDGLAETEAFYAAWKAQSTELVEQFNASIADPAWGIDETFFETIKDKYEATTCYIYDAVMAQGMAACQAWYVAQAFEASYSNSMVEAAFGTTGFYDTMCLLCYYNDACDSCSDIYSAYGLSSYTECAASTSCSAAMS